ncbi:hypothetical protein [Planctomonas psychrotolerans]|uniref:hypothetical protein n=1 Tax=Planctomonas psychrotolerans TaxID=2528712 RepID=UPI001238B31F|nr:hypothetical protein [Planctomonas psychrotolerans]
MSTDVRRAARNDRGEARYERGFTLVELLIYSMLSIVVLLIVGGILINSLRAEQLVRTSTDATSTGQLVSQSVTTGVRNASAIAWSEPAPGTELLLVRTVGSGATETWSCQAWHFGGGEVRTTRSTSLIPTPTAAALSGWTLLVDGAAPSAGSPVFDLDATERRVDLTVEVAAGTGKPVLIKTSALSRQPVSPTGAESAPCF